MKRMLVSITGLSVALAAAAACAGSETPDAPYELPPDRDGGPTTIPEGGTPRDGAQDHSIPRDVCSAAGWCPTQLPDTNLSLSDIWPLEKHAFAIAQSETRGLKILEWDSATATWSFIDDGTQNGYRGQPGNIWAPSDDEVYYGVLDLETLFSGKPTAANVYHGVRKAPPATGWTWTMSRFGCDAFDFIQPRVWGTSSDDVHVLTCRRIHHSPGGDAGAGGDAGDAGMAPWPVVYVDDDVDFPIQFLGATGTARDDAWFVGGRGAYPGVCSVIIRKTGTGYARIADAVPDDDGNCGTKAGLLNVEGAFGSGVHATSKGTVVGARSSMDIGNEVVRISTKAGGGYTVDVTRLPPSLPVSVSSVWGLAEDDLWAIGAVSFGAGGTVVRGTKMWSDAGTYGYSTVAMNGAPNVQPLYQVRGTSNTNLWAVGVERAFHKTTP